MKLKETFDLKIVTFLTASPDEVVKALTDEKLRLQWDIDLTKIKKVPG